MRTNVLNDLSNVVKKGTGLACSWSQVGRMSEGAPDEHPMSIRSASDGERWKPAGEKGSTRVWKHVAMIFAVLVMSMANVGMVWGKTWNVSLSGSGVSQDGITLTGVYAANASVGSSSKKANSFNTNYSSAYIFSEQKNITAISFTVCRNTNGASAGDAVTVATSTGGAFAVQTSNFTATNNGSSISSLTNIQAVGNNQANQNTIVITFADGYPVQAVELRKASASLIFNISVTYEDETLPSSIFNATISGSTPAATVTPAGTSLTLSVNSSSPKTIGSDKYYQWNSDNVISLGSGKFQAGDIIIADVCGSRNNKAAGFKVNGGSTEYVVTFSASSHGQVFYTVSAGDGVAGQSSVTLKRKSSDTYVHAFRVLRSGAAPEPSCDEITPSLSYDHPTLVLTQTTTANPTLDKDGSAGAVTWTSSNTDVATVNSSGVVTAKGAGSATITASIAANGDNCAGEATATINVAAAPLGIVDQKLATGNVAWDASVIVTSNPTNITSLTALSHHGTATASGNGNTSNGGQTSKIGTATGDFNASNYLELSFTVASGKRLNVSSVAIPVQPVTSNTNNFRAVLSDNQGSSNIEGSTTNQTQGTLSNITFSSFGTLKGTVTLRIYAWGWSNGYRLGKNIVIDGTIEDDVTPSCTDPNHVDITSSTGEFGFFGGETITLTAQAYSSAGTGSPIAEGSITGYQWKHNGTNISGATSKTLTISNCTVADAGDYSCVVSTGATCSTESSSYGTKVYVLQQYIGGETTYNFTRVGTSKVGTVNVTLAASTQREFKIYAGTMTSESYYMGNNGTIDEDASNWDFEGGKNNVKLNPGLGGTFTFTIDYTANGGAPKVSVTYPRKTIYLTPGVWNADGAKFAIHYFRDGGSTGWTDFLTANDCGMSAEIPQWNGITVIPVRFNPSDATPGWNGDGHVWNQTNDITLNSNNSVVITGWNASDFTYGTYAVPTYTISYAKGTPAASIDGSKADETKTCGVAFTLPNSAVFTRTGYTQTGWTTSDGGAQEYALGGTYTTNEDKTFYPVWTVNQYTVTHTLDGVTKSSGATGANAATYGTNYTAVFAASSGYALPETITVTIGGSTKTQGTEYTWDKASGTVTITGSYITGDIVITVTGESDDPCTEPDEVANEIARFFVPCGLSNATSGSPTAWGVTNQDASTGDNTFTTSGFGGGSSNWYRNETSGLIYGKLSGNSSYILLKLKSGSFQAGDVVTAYFNRNDATKTGLTLKTQGSSYAITPGSTAAGVETSGTYTLVADAIEADGSIKLFRANSSSYVNRIIVTRPACTNVSITTQPTTPVAATVGSACSITGLVAAGTSPTYQWYTCNSDGSGATAITSAGAMSFTGYTSATLGLTPTAAGATYYKCVVSGSCGDPVTSNVVTVNASAAPASALITYNLNVGTSASTTIKSSTSTTDGTNITNIDIDQTNDGANGAGASDRTTKLALATGTTASAVAEPDKYEVFTFKVACGKKVTPSEVKIKVANVGGSAGGNQNYKAVLSDTYGHSISNTFTGTKSDGSVEEFSITNGSSVYFQGVVTLKLWSCKGSGGNASAFRMGTPLEIYGEVGNQATPAATITWNTQPANGQVGDPDFAYDVTCSDGSTVTVTSANTTYATIVGGKLHYAAAGTTHLVATATDACGNVVVQNSSNFTVSAAAPTYSVTHSLTNVTATSGATGAGAATEGVAYNAVFAANTGYVLPSTITVTIDGSPATVGTGYTWNASTGAFQVPAAQVTGAIVITIAGVTAPATKDIYYGAITITAGALTKGSTGTSQFFTNIGGTIANNTEISWSSGPGTGGEYYESNVLTDTELSKSSNWNTSSGSNRYVGGMKFQNGSTYTLALGSKVASSITFYGRNGSASKTMTIGGEDWTSSSTKNTFAKHVFSKSGGFTGNVTITEDGDFYGILVITIQTATPCTTPVIPALSNQSLCEGTDIAAWNATVTNAAAIEAAGETVAYSWKKKGNDTELATTATFDLGSATESQAGTYVVTVTVSKAGKASSSAYREVELSVTDGEEVTGITADKATVYPGNSVTLTATANTPATWQWYTCTNAEGDGEAIISGAESASYTIASAGAAGTYYYKAKATGSCGTAEAVYTLTVTAASECEKYFWFVYAADATTNGVVNNRDGFFTGAPTGSSNSSTYKFTLDGTEYKATKNTGSGSFSISFTIPEGSTATMGINCKGSSSKPLYLTHSSGTPQKLVSNSSSNASCTVENITEGTWTLTSAGSWTLAALGVQVCTTSSCTDATPTITAANTTVCVGSELSISSTGYETSPESIQWQKLNGSAWDNISGATAATYTVASATAADAGSYRVVVTKGCARTSNTVTIAVPSAPVFADFTATRSVMATLALSITDVEASDATSYAWYKSADATYDAGTDTKVGTSKELLLASGGEAAGATYYLFCVASNSCGSTPSGAITVSVTALVEEDCATKGSEGAAEFGFNYESGIGSGNAPNTSIPCWKSQGKAAYLTYTAPDGKYFSRVTMNVLVSSGSKAAYGYSTDGGTTWTYADLTGLTSSLADKSLTLPANVNAFRVGRNFDPSYGVTSGTFYLSKICFEYTDACTATTVTPDATSKTHTIGESFTAPIFTLAPGAVSSGTLTYSSSDEEIASVDESGNVTFNGTAGTVTITASYAGATIADVDYCASEGSYTITVSCEGGAPKVVADGSVNMSGCNNSVILNAKKQDGTTDFTGGSYQWFRNGEEIAGATGKSYTASQTGVYTVAYTSAGGCTSPSTNSATVTSATVEPEITKLVPFHYYHVDKTYTAQMKDRHLFSVKGSAAYGSTGKNFKLTMSRNGGAATDITTTASIFVTKSGDGQVDTVMIDLNKLSGKYSEGDELVLTCAAVDCSGNVSAVYKDEITINVIGATPTLALICSGTDIAAGTRDTKKLTVGGDFLTGYNVADLCQQTGDKSFDANTEWGLYTRLKENYIVTPVNGYAVFNKLNYEPFDILLLTDYPKASKSDAAKTVLDDMAALCDYRPMLSFKTHMVAKSPSKWAAKGFTTSATENKADGRLNLNIVCYAHPMFEGLKSGEDVYEDANNTSAPLVYTMLSGTGYESSKGMQGFELAAAENFVTIGLTHYNGRIAKDSPLTGEAEWTPLTEDRMLVTVAERQTNIEARFILFSLNCGAQSKLTERGEQVILACLEYLLDDDPLHVADCSFTFDNGASNEHDAAWYSEHCNTCTGTKGDGKWTTAANWGPDYRLLPGEFTSVRIKKPVEVDDTHAHVMEVRIIDEGRIDIPAGKALDVKSTIRRMDGTEIYPTEENDIHIGSASTGNGTLIFNNDEGDTKARVDMYSNALADVANMSAATSTWQYIGTPHSDVASATHNYYNSWLYQYSGSGWEVIPNGGPLVPFRGYCVTHPDAPVVFGMEGTLVATTTQDIAIPAGYTVIANSWVAPIDISTFTDDDMENISDKTIYFFNTGSDAEGNHGTGTEAGTYVAVPKNSASYVGTWQIPSMQGFYISTETAGTLHLDYDRHVRPTGSRSVVSNPMYAPRRAAAESNEPNVLKIFARGSRYQDKLVVLEREDFTRGYDSGWDGEAWGGGTLSPMVYVIGEGREDAVSAIPEFEGTVVAFKAGEDSEYRFEFIYDGDESLYLFDTENNTYTQIMTGESYYFSTDDKAPHSRFILTRKAPQIATGVEPTSDGEGAKARKLLIEDKMYILLNGMLYDATGKVVK